MEYSNCKKCGKKMLTGVSKLCEACRICWKCGKTENEHSSMLNYGNGENGHTILKRSPDEQAELLRRFINRKSCNSGCKIFGLCSNDNRCPFEFTVHCGDFGYGECLFLTTIPKTKAQWNKVRKTFRNIYENFGELSLGRRWSIPECQKKV